MLHCHCLIGFVNGITRVRDDFLFFHVPSDRSTSEGQINKSREKKLAAISLYICWLFIFCHAWKLIPTAYEVKP